MVIKYLKIINKINKYIQVGQCKEEKGNKKINGGKYLLRCFWNGYENKYCDDDIYLWLFMLYLWLFMLHFLFNKNNNNNNN